MWENFVRVLSARHFVAALSFLSVLCLAPSVEARGPSALQVVKNVSANYAHLENYHFEGALVMQDGELQLPIQMVADANGRLRLKLWREGGHTVFISDGQRHWFYDAERNEYVKKGEGFDVEEVLAYEDSPLTLLDEYAGLADNIRSAKLLRSETLAVNGQPIPCYVVAVTPKTPLSVEPGLSYSSVYWIAQDNFLVLRNVVTERRGKTVVSKITTTFDKAVVNKAPDAKLFAFQPPSGATDMTAKAAPPASDSKLKDQPAPAFTLKDIEGKPVSLESLRGKVVLISFWASWCPPCRAELPDLERLHREYKDSGLVVLGINLEDTPTALAFMQENGYTFKTLVDAEHTVSTAYGVVAIPSVVIVDQHGKVIEQFRGRRNRAELLTALQQAGLSCQSE